jgi:prephenate dehydratase
VDAQLFPRVFQYSRKGKNMITEQEYKNCKEYLMRINESLVNDIIGSRNEINKIEEHLKELKQSIKYMEREVLRNIELMPFIDIDYW